MITKPPATLPRRIPSDSADDMWVKVSPAHRRGKGLGPNGGTQTRGGDRSPDGECRWRCRKCLGEPFARVIYYSSGAIW